MAYKLSKYMGLPLQASNSLSEYQLELMQIVSNPVFEQDIFQVASDEFVRIEIWGIGWEIQGLQA